MDKLARRRSVPLLMAMLLSLAGCGGGGDAAPATPPAGPGPGSGPAVGTLTVTGAGAALAGGGGSFVPAGAAVASGSGPTCAIDAGTLKCLSNFSIVWSESSDEALVAFLWSENKPSPGVAPGVGVTGVSLTYSVFLSSGVGYACLQRLGCDFAAAGISFDATARTLTFNNTLVSPAGQPAVVFNGTLKY